jgi:hypothetical protein
MGELIQPVKMIVEKSVGFRIYYNVTKNDDELIDPKEENVFITKIQELLKFQQLTITEDGTCTFGLKTEGGSIKKNKKAVKPKPVKPKPKK